MTKREVIRQAWQIATGRSPYTIGVVREQGRGYAIGMAMFSSSLNEFSSEECPRDENGLAQYRVIRHEGRWDTEEHQATQAEIEEYLFGDWSSLS